MVLVLNRLDECPDFVTHAAYVDDGRLAHGIVRGEDGAFAELAQLLHLRTSDLELPPPDPAIDVPDLDPDEPLVRLTGATIRYVDNLVFEDLDWTIEPGDHWQVHRPERQRQDVPAVAHHR